MTILAIFCALLGASMGLRFKMLVLVPATVAVILCIAVIATAWGDHAWTITLKGFAGAAGLQLGYVFGSFARSIMAASRTQPDTVSPPASATARTSA